LVGKSKKNRLQAAPERVCMFQNPQPVMENETSTSKIILSEPLERVCMFEIPLPVVEKRSNINSPQLSFLYKHL